MNVCVFISSTCKDLEQDCRPAAIQAITKIAVAVTMEKWVTDFDDSIEVCHEKLKQESSHYLGIFAYRRGWAPKKLGGKSITEVEFEWACEGGKTMAVFVPRPATPFDVELRNRAADQDAADAQAQESFRKYVMGLGNTIMLFESPVDLASSAGIKVALWSGGGIRSIASQGAEAQATKPAAMAPVISEEALARLGRREQADQFLECLENPPAQGPQETFCFLIYGQSGFGHQEMLSRLWQELTKERSGIRRCKVDVGPAWRSNDLATLVEITGQELDRQFTPDAIEKLAARLKEALEAGDVVLEITNLQRLDGSLTAFAEKFWQPIVAAQAAAPAHRLIVLCGFEQSLAAAWDALLYRPDDEGGFDPSRLIVLPELTAFKEKELTPWLKNQGLPAQAAQRWAGTLITETGGYPPTLYRKLEDEAIWRDRKKEG